MRESARAAAAFEDYWALGPQRSQKKLLLSYEGRPEHLRVTRSRTMVGRWSARFGWQQRVMERQAEQARELREAVSRRQQQAVAQHLEVVREQMEIARRYLRPPEGNGEGGIDAGRWKPAPRELEAATLAIDKAIHHQRLALGLPTNVTRQDLLLRETLSEALALQQTTRAIIEEHLCDDCRERLAEELRRLGAAQQALAARLT